MLARSSPLRVDVAAEGKRFRPGVCYIGEPDAHLALVGGDRATLVDGSGQEYRNRTIDLLFYSVAAQAKGNMVGVILSGLLDDGSRGLAAIKAAGGTTIVLAPRGKSSDDMAKNAREYAGPVDVIGRAASLVSLLEKIFASRHCSGHSRTKASQVVFKIHEGVEKIRGNGSVLDLLPNAAGKRT